MWQSLRRASSLGIGAFLFHPFFLVDGFLLLKVGRSSLHLPGVCIPCCFSRMPCPRRLAGERILPPFLQDRLVNTCIDLALRWNDFALDSIRVGLMQLSYVPRMWLYDCTRVIQGCALLLFDTQSKRKLHRVGDSSRMMLVAVPHFSSFG